MFYWPSLALLGHLHAKVKQFPWQVGVQEVVWVITEILQSTLHLVHSHFSHNLTEEGVGGHVLPPGDIVELVQVSPLVRLQRGLQIGQVPWQEADEDLTLSMGVTIHEAEY